MNKLDYDQIYKEIKLANDVINRETGVQPRYVRTRSGDYRKMCRWRQLISE